MSRLLIILLTILALSSCTGKKFVDIKSPCVSNEGGPCGPKKSINNWWLNPQAQS